MKTQTIRIIDVFIIGPVMMKAGYHLRNRPIGSVLAVFGLSTIIYNLYNYLQKERFPDG